MRVRSAVCCVLVSLSVVGCWRHVTWLEDGSNSSPTTTQPFGEESRLAGPAPVVGRIGWALLLARLRQSGDVSDAPPYPGADDEASVPLGARLRDVLALIESRFGWCYDAESRSFGVAAVTHPSEGADALGRWDGRGPAPWRVRRPAMVLSVRLRRVEGGVTQSPAARAAAVWAQASLRVHDGVPASLQQVDERGYFEGVAGTDGQREIQTVRRTVQAGTELRVTVGRLEGMCVRVSGEVAVSSFGDGLSRSRLSVPIEQDLPRGEWVAVASISGADMSAVFGRAWSAGASASAALVELLVR